MKGFSNTELHESSSSTPNNEMLTIPQMADRLQISLRKAYELRSRKDFPSYNLGERQIRVRWSEVLKWLKGE